MNFLLQYSVLWLFLFFSSTIWPRGAVLFLCGMGLKWQDPMALRRTNEVIHVRHCGQCLACGQRSEVWALISGYFYFYLGKVPCINPFSKCPFRPNLSVSCLSPLVLAPCSAYGAAKKSPPQRCVGIHGHDHSAASHLNLLLSSKGTKMFLERFWALCQTSSFTCSATEAGGRKFNQLLMRNWHQEENPQEQCRCSAPQGPWDLHLRLPGRCSIFSCGCAACPPGRL